MKLEMRDDVVPGPGPVIHPENAGFWRSLDEGVFRLQRCSDCGTVRFPVAPCCWNCLSPRHTWVEADGDGRVVAAVTIERATGNQKWQGAVPFNTGLVDTRADVRLPGRILCRCGRAMAEGTPVRMVRIPSLTGDAVYAFEHECEEGTDD